MIKIIYGQKGFGKTKLIIDSANEAVKNAKGNVVFVTDTKRYMFDIVHQVRVIDAKDYKLESEDSLNGFIKGLLAGNSDIETIFIDGAARIANKEIAQMQSFYKMLERLSNELSVKFVVTVSADISGIPEFIKKFIQ